MWLFDEEDKVQADFSYKMDFIICFKAISGLKISIEKSELLPVGSMEDLEV